MKHINTVKIRCSNPSCEEEYLIALSANADRHMLEIRFTSCPYCKYSRETDYLRRYWGKPRCWECKIPFELIKEHGCGLCYTCYKMKWKQHAFVPKEDLDATL